MVKKMIDELKQRYINEIIKLISNDIPLTDEMNYNISNRLESADDNEIERIYDSFLRFGAKTTMELTGCPF